MTDKISSKTLSPELKEIKKSLKPIMADRGLVVIYPEIEHGPRKNNGNLYYKNNTKIVLFGSKDDSVDVFIVYRRNNPPFAHIVYRDWTDIYWHHPDTVLVMEIKKYFKFMGWKVIMNGWS